MLFYLYQINQEEFMSENLVDTEHQTLTPYEQYVRNQAEKTIDEWDQIWNSDDLPELTTFDTDFRELISRILTGESGYLEMQTKQSGELDREA
jgi:hypothetical protein